MSSSLSDTDTDTDTDSAVSVPGQIFKLKNGSIPAQGMILNRPGTYRFTEDITWRPDGTSPVAFRITCDGVVVDFSNFSLTLRGSRDVAQLATAIVAVGDKTRFLSNIKVCCGTLKGFPLKALVLAHVRDAVITRVVVGTATAVAFAASAASAAFSQSFLIINCSKVRVLWCAFDSLSTRIASFCCVRVVSCTNVMVADVSIVKCRALAGCRFYAGVSVRSSLHVKVVKCRIGSIVAAPEPYTEPYTELYAEPGSIFAGVYLRECEAASVLHCRVSRIEVSDMMGRRAVVYGMYLQACARDSHVLNCDVHEIRAGGSSQHAVGVAIKTCKGLRVVQCAVSYVEAPKKENAIAFNFDAEDAETVFDKCSVVKAGIAFSASSGGVDGEKFQNPCSVSSKSPIFTNCTVDGLPYKKTCK